MLANGIKDLRWNYVSTRENVFLDLNILSRFYHLELCLLYLADFFFFVCGGIQNNTAYSASVYRIFFPIGMCVYISGLFKVILTMGS